MSRIESGPIQFGDDWPGLFLRGDDCFHYASHLRRVLETVNGIDNLIPKALLRSLLDDLESTNIHNRSTDSVPIELLKPAEECAR